MPVLKIKNITSYTSPVNINSSNVSNSVSGNINLITSQINQKTNDYINVKNAVKILENYSNWNGYIKLYTEVENNFEINDIIYITYTKPTINPASTFNLENPLQPLGDFYLGYKILYVNKYRNELVINRRYNDITAGLKLKDQYLSKFSCRGGEYYNDVSDGCVFYDCDILSSSFSTIYGTVTGSTIQNAIIRCAELYTTSDSNGYYELNIPSGENIVKCYAGGYITNTFTINILSNIKELINIGLITGTTSITIYSNTTSVCLGGWVNFTSSQVGYNAPVTYQWKINGSNVFGATNTTFNYNSFNYGDIVTCVVNDGLYSSTSNSIIISIIEQSIIINVDPSNNIIYEGQTVTFDAFVSCYESPEYQWRVNNLIVGTNSHIFTGNTFNNGDIIVCKIGFESSNSITLTVLQATTTTTTAATTTTTTTASTTTTTTTAATTTTTTTASTTTTTTTAATTTTTTTASTTTTTTTEATTTTTTTEATTTTTTTTAYSLSLKFDAIENADLLISGNSSSVSDWNTFFNLPTNGTSFSSLNISGNTVTLYGGSNIILDNYLFGDNDPTGTSLLEIIDENNIVIECRTGVFSDFNGGNGCYGLTKVHLPNCSILGDEVFAGCTNLEDFILPFSGYTSLGNSTFNACGIVGIGGVINYFINVTSVGNDTFTSCMGVDEFNFPNLINAGDTSFSQTSAAIFNFPLLETCGHGTFTASYSMIEYNFDSLKNIGNNVFGAITLSTFTLTSLETCGTSAFYNASNLETINLPVLTSIGGYAFAFCSFLTTIYLPSCINLGETVGIDYVFGQNLNGEIVGNAITLTIPSSLMTCDGGNPDGDIVALHTNNYVTIIEI